MCVYIWSIDCEKSWLDILILKTETNSKYTEKLGLNVVLKGFSSGKQKLDIYFSG